MKYTQNYNLRKPEDTDPADIQDLNYNADAIDGKLKEIEDWETTHLQASNPHSITPALIGAETPTGAQQKANQAETNAKSYADIVTNSALNSAKNYADGVLESANSHTDQVASDLSQKVDETKIKVLDVEQDVSNITKALTNLNPNQEAKQSISGYGILSLPQNAANSPVSVTVKGYTGVLDMTWKQIQDLVRRGKHIDIFTIGDQFVANYDGVEYIWDVIGINHDIPTDKNYINSLTLQAHDCIMNCQFDAPEALYYAEVELPAGTHVFTLNELKYRFTTTEVVPVGGQVFISAWSGDSYIPTTITTYAADRTTIIETDLAVTSASGTDTITPVNHHERCKFGSNNYVESAIRQFINSDEELFTWLPKTNFDRPPSGAAYTGGGFLKLLDPKLVAVLGAVDKQVARNTVTDDGGQDTFSDKVFLLSRVEVYGGTEGVTTGENPYPYYASLAPNPTADALAGRIKYLGGSARTWWLRSPYVGGASIPRYVHTSGSVNNNHSANTAYGLAPACCII